MISPIIVSLTTIPSRFSTVSETLDSLVAQTLPLERIFLNIPKQYRRFPGVSISDEACVQLQDKYGALLAINRPDRDYGPGTKLLGSLEQPLSVDAFLILVDDDSRYHPQAIEILSRHIAEDAARGISRAYTFFAYDGGGFPIGQGTDMFAIPVHVLRQVPAFFEVIQGYPSIFFQDDVWLSYFLHKKNIEIVSLLPYGRVYLTTKDPDALSKLEGQLSRDRIIGDALSILHLLDEQKRFDFLYD